MDQKYAIRACLLYDFKLKKTAAESHRSLMLAFGDIALSERQCRRWFERFHRGDESLEDDEHGKRPQLLDNDLLLSSIESNPAQSIRELAITFNCSKSTIAEHLKTLGKVNRSGKWVPHVLTDPIRAARVMMSGILLRKVKTSGFLESIVTSDEKWIHFDNTTKKRQWLSPGEPPNPVPKPDTHGKKVMLCVWWNSKGLVFMDVLNPGETVNSEVYLKQLMKVDQALQRQGVDTSKTNLLHDNARPHVAKIVQQKIEELGWNVLPHPPYSPDIAPCDYHLFRSMQHGLEEQQFKKVDDVRIWVSSFFDSQPAQFFEKGIYSLRERWRTVIDSVGEYIIE